MLRGCLFALAGALLILVVLVIGSCVFVFNGRLKSIDSIDDPVTTATGNYHVKLQHDGRERQYYVHVPPAASSGSAPLALVLALHGGGGHASSTDSLMHIIPVADSAGFIVVFPDGVSKNWNDGRVNTGSKTEKENIDDVGFIRAVISDVESKLNVDRKRVYSTGISNGAFMSERLACDASDVIAAVGLVAGTAPDGFESTCKPGRPVSMIAILGTKDPLVPYEGGLIDSPFPFGLGRSRGRVVAAAALTAFWSKNNGCSPDPVIIEVNDAVKSDKSHVVLDAYANCAAASAFDFYHVEGGGHTWPGGKQYLSHYLVGRTNRDINATQLIWRFFAAHPMP